MVTKPGMEPPATTCPYCSGEFTPERTVTYCTDCGYIPGKGAD